MIQEYIYINKIDKTTNNFEDKHNESKQKINTTIDMKLREKNVQQLKKSKISFPLKKCKTLDFNIK